MRLTIDGITASRPAPPAPEPAPVKRKKTTKRKAAEPAGQAGNESEETA